MDSQSAPELTIGESLIWVNYMFGLTEKAAQAIPEELLDWRPQDFAGGGHFSLAEIVMHIADARRMFGSQLSGADESANYYAPEYWTGAQADDEPPRFKEHGGKQALLDGLKAARELYAPYLGLPLSELISVPEGSRRAFERMIAEFKEAGQDTAAHERHGPGTIFHALMAVIAYESGHRGTLETLLRMNGVDLPDS